MNTVHYASLHGRSCIVTGAGRGFGRLMALGLVAQGAQVVGSSARNKSELEETAYQAKALGGPGRFVPVLADVTSVADCERLVRTALAQFGSLQVLINNAARGPREADENFFAAKPKFWDARLRRPSRAWSIRTLRASSSWPVQRCRRCSRKASAGS
jgi:NAD(P)-dependent dehydrogenase (short-subunit alcohol dehydrogenase family)